MGDKKVSKRTLPSGEEVFHHPPDKDHPDGKQVLVRDPHASPMRRKLNDALGTNKAAHEELHQRRREAIERKRAAEDAAGVPPDKRSC